jgi:hypothetical protein
VTILGKVADNLAVQEENSSSAAKGASALTCVTRISVTILGKVGDNLHMVQLENSSHAAEADVTPTSTNHHLPALLAARGVLLLRP